MHLIATGKLGFDTPEARQAFCFPNPLSVPDHLHMVYNALEEAMETSDAWAPFEPLFREACSFFGDQPNRDRFVAVCMSETSAGTLGCFWSLPLPPSQSRVVSACNL